MKKYLFPFFFLFTLFSDEIFRAYLSASGSLVVTGMYQNMYMAIAAVAYGILLHDLFTGKLRNRVISFLTIILGVVLLFGITYLLYSGGTPKFITSILYFGSVCVSAAACGMHVAITKSWKEINRLLPFFLLVVGIIVGLFGMRTLAVNIMTELESPLDYQTVSYFMAEIVGFSCYYVFFYTERKSLEYKVMRWLLWALMAFSAVVVLLSGGRGGFVLLVIEIFIMLLLLSSYKRVNKGQLVLIGILGIIAFLVLATKMSIFDTAGFERITSTLTEDDNRKELYGLAWKSFKSSPIIGHGLGSVWMEVGFYSHNVVMDLLVEGGLAGLLLFFIIYARTVLKLWKWHKIETNVVFMIFALLKVSIMLLFSGYWLNALQLWMVFGFVYIASTKYYWFDKKIIARK